MERPAKAGALDTLLNFVGSAANVASQAGEAYQKFKSSAAKSPSDLSQTTQANAAAPNATTASNKLWLWIGGGAALLLVLVLVLTRKR